MVAALAERRVAQVAGQCARDQSDRPAGDGVAGPVVRGRRIGTGLNVTSSWWASGFCGKAGWGLRGGSGFKRDGLDRRGYPGDDAEQSQEGRNGDIEPHANTG